MAQIHSSVHLHGRVFSSPASRPRKQFSCENGGAAGPDWPPGEREGVRWNKRALSSAWAERSLGTRVAGESAL